MKSITILILLAALYPLGVNAQSVGIGTNNPKPSAKLDVRSTTQGVTLPSMSSVQRKAIINPAKGLMVFDTDKSCFYFFDGQAWRALNGMAGRNVSPTFAVYPGTLSFGDDYGWSIAMDNNFTLVGFPQKDSNTVANAGAVYLFKKQEGNQWTLYQTLFAPDPEANSGFGYSCAIDSNYMVIGAPYKYAGTLAGAGKIYLYRFDGSSWVYETAFSLTLGSQANARFGWSVAISHVGQTTYAFASSPEYSSLANTSTGRLDIFQRNAQTGVWSVTAVYLGTQPNLNLGYTLAAEGAHVIAGAPGYDSVYNNKNYANTGCVFTYRLNGSNWVRGDNLTTSPDTSNYYGYRVAFKDSVAAVGGINSQSETNGSNRIWVYRLSNNSTWNTNNILFTDNLMESSNCGGYSLAINKHFLLAIIPGTVYYGLNCSSGYPSKLVVFKAQANSYKYYTHTNLDIARVALDGLDYAGPGTEFDSGQPNGIFFGNLEE